MGLSICWGGVLYPLHCALWSKMIGSCLTPYIRSLVVASSGTQGTRLMIWKRLRRMVSAILASTRLPLEITAHHIMTSTIALIRWWLDYQMCYSPERMGMIYYE